MQLAVITDEIDTNLDHALEVMLEYGVRHAELREVYKKNITTMTPDEVSEVGRTLKRYNVQAIGIASPFYKTDLPATGEGVTGPLHGASALGFSEQIDLLQRCIAIAKQLGAPFVRTFTFWKHGTLTPEIEDRIVDAYAEPARMAEEAGITLIVENEHACYAGTGAETARIVSRIASPVVKIVWDPGNAIFAGEQAFPSGYEAVKPFTAHVHVKDAKVDAAGGVEWTVVGEGLIDWPGQIQALKKDGYDGYLSLETHYRGAGSAEASTRQCLEALKRIFEAS